MVGMVGWPTENIAGHKDKDIEIYRVAPDSILPTKHAYVLVTYRMKDEQLKSNKPFIYGFDHVFEKVSYIWENDTILNYKLFNLSDTLSESFTYTINGENNSTISRVTAKAE